MFHRLLSCSPPVSTKLSVHLLPPTTHTHTQRETERTEKQKKMRKENAIQNQADGKKASHVCTYVLVREFFFLVFENSLDFLFSPYLMRLKESIGST